MVDETVESVPGDLISPKDEAAQRLRAGGMSEDEIKSRLTSFNIFDKNADGVVDMNELKSGLFEKFGTTATDEEIKSAVASFDKNNNGVLEADEFVVGQIKRLIEVKQDEARNAVAETKRKEMEEKRVRDAGGPIPAAFIEANTDTGIGTRAAACVPYLLPLVDATNYGFALLSQAPVAAAALFPFVAIFRAIPFSGFLAFLFFGQQARNPSNPSLLRFNLQQAMLLDICLFVPRLISEIIPSNPQLRALGEPASDAIFFIAVGAIFYCWFTNLATGKFPNKLPFISDAAENTTGPQED